MHTEQLTRYSSLFARTPYLCANVNKFFHCKERCVCYNCCSYCYCYQRCWYSQSAICINSNKINREWEFNQTNGRRYVHLTSPPCNENDEVDLLTEMLSSNFQASNIENDDSTNKNVEWSSSSSPEFQFKDNEQCLSEFKERSNKSEDTIASSAAPQHIMIKMHNLPPNWLYEEIIEFIDQVAEHANIQPPVESTKEPFMKADNLAENGASALPQVQSPFIKHIVLPFGRRTGIVYGEPVLKLTSLELANYLINDLSFSEDDYRQRIYFTKLTERNDLHNNHTHVGVNEQKMEYVDQVSFISVEETIEKEKAEALRTLELDRYLFSPDLLWEITRKNQKKLLTRNEKIYADSFLTSNNNNSSKGNNEEETLVSEHLPSDDNCNEHFDESSSYSSEAFDVNVQKSYNISTEKNEKKRKTKHKHNSQNRKAKRVVNRLAGEQDDVGRGASVNIPISSPYVRDRIV